MATTVVLQDIIKSGGRILAKWNDGSLSEYMSLQSLTETLGDLNANVDVVKLLCLGYLMARSADLSNLASVQNKNFIFDLTAPSPIRVQ